MKLRRILGGLGVIALAAVGTQLVTVQASSAHTPSASVTCTTWSIGAHSYQAAQNNTYSYSVDGAPVVTGSFGASFAMSGTFAAGTGNHTLVGYVYQNNLRSAQYSRTYDLTTTGCSTYVPVPAAPLPLPPTCAAAGAATVPDNTADVTWTLQGNVATATVKYGTKFTDGTVTKTFTENVLAKFDPNSDGCATHVTAAAPAFAEGDCVSAPSLADATAGIGYTVAVTGTADFGNAVTVTFTAMQNYRLDGRTVYTFTFAAKPDCRTVVNPQAPDVVQATCEHSTGVINGFAIKPVTTDGIVYTVSDLDVTARADDTHKLTDTDGWIVDRDGKVAHFTATRDDPTSCLIDASPAVPVVVDSGCSDTGTTPIAPTLNIVDQADVTYTQTPGPYVGGGSAIVTATATVGHWFTIATLPSGWTLAGAEPTGTTATYAVTFAAAPVCMTATAPTYANDVCVAGTRVRASVTLPPSDAADYFIDGQLTSDGSHPATDGSLVTVTVEPLAGYQLTGTTSWTHQFSAAPTCSEVGGGHVVRPPAAHAPAHQPVAATIAPLASTGVPTMSFLLIGGALLLIGGALCVAATTRRGSRS